ncbi:MAG: hypothetical protein ACJ77K_15130 [Bacteroidia bacterium]
MKPTRYFRTTTKEYCHISDDAVFIFNSKEPTRIPLEHELGDAWSVKAVINYIWFGLITLYLMFAATYYGNRFFTVWDNYPAILLLFWTFIRMRNFMVGSTTPTIQRSKITNVLFKKPAFSFAKLVIYFEGPEGKILRRIISVKYPKEAMPVLIESGLMK